MLKNFGNYGRFNNQLDPNKELKNVKLPKTRHLAKSLGYRHYYTGVPCKQGHDSVRYTSVGTCLVCQRNFTHIWQKNNRDRLKQLQRNYLNKLKSTSQ